MELPPGHYDTGAAQERTLDKRLSVEQRGEDHSYLIIVAIFLAQGLFVAEPFVHGFGVIGRTSARCADKGVFIPTSLLSRLRGFNQYLDPKA